ncbi:hypothetical protein B0H19DRAFT_295890 [Mycena capillaripes]|nr:hypothetical protein B0H19DRAFT_295890 [Mycena capillaripes]
MPVDPISVTTTVITLATFIKDLIEVGQSIQRSIEKVGENRRRIRDLTNDILRTLADLANLTRGQEDSFQAPALLSALGNLKAEMLHVHSICKEISSVQRPGFRKIGSQFKVWMKRDDVERKIAHLKEHVNKCYVQFTAFSAARIEQATARIEGTSLQAVNTTLRVEQTLIVNNVESQVKLRRLEGMMARVLLETQFGQNVLNETIEVISSDPSHKTLEFQFLSAQTMRLIDCLRQLLSRGNLTLDQSAAHHLPVPLQFRFIPMESTLHLHVLHWILGTVLEIHHSHATIQAESVMGIIINLGAKLAALGMISESITWHLLKIQIFRPLAGGECAAGTLAQLVHSLTLLSVGYQVQLQYERAMGASKEALDQCIHLSEGFPVLDNRLLLLNTTVIHAQNLYWSSQEMAALSTAQDAVVLARPITEQIIGSSCELFSLTEEDEFKAQRSRAALVIFGRVLSSLGRHLESYGAFKEAFYTIMLLPESRYSFTEAELDTFIDQICKVAEGGEFSLVMLADCVILFRNLARKYPRETCSQFLCVLHAHAYFSHQENSPDMKPSTENLRIFLEPDSDCLPPPLDITVHIDEFNAHGGIIDDVVRAFYYHWHPHAIVPVIRSIFFTHFEQAVVVLRDVVMSACSDLYFQWNHIGMILFTTLNAVEFLPLISNLNRLTVLRILTKTIVHLGSIITDFLSRSLSNLAHGVTVPFLYELWTAGLLEEAVAVSDHRIKYLCHPRSNAVDNLGSGLVDHAFLLCEMGRIPEAIEVAQQMERILPNFTEKEGIIALKLQIVLPCIIKIRILRRTRRSQEALQLCRKEVAKGCRQNWTEDGEMFNIGLYFLLVELGATWDHVGAPDRALKDAERAVAACRKEVDDEDVEGQICLLVHSLTTLSNCLAAVERKDESLAIAQEAVSTYNKNAPHMWGDLLYTLRRQELGANAFHSLSLRLAISGDPDQALSNAEKATELYPELVGLAPRHLPTLASSLQNLASTLWKIGRQDEAIDACDEAVDIMRKVVEPETYFLPAFVKALELLVGYLTAKGDVEKLPAVTAECEETQRKFASLPPERDFLFEEVEIESDDEGHENVEEAWETASEADEEYYDALTTRSDAEVTLAITPPAEAQTAGEFLTPVHKDF